MVSVLCPHQVYFLHVDINFLKFLPNFPLYSHGLHIEIILTQFSTLSVTLPFTKNRHRYNHKSLIWVCFVWDLSDCSYQGVLLSHLGLLTSSLMRILCFTRFIEKIFVFPTFQFRLIGNI